MPPVKAPGNLHALRVIWRLATSDGVPRRSLKVAIVVGTALNLINQGDALWGEASINWFKLALTFAMPYAVSTYGAVAARWHDGHAGKSDGKFSN
jgi:hypothetical protein